MTTEALRESLTTTAATIPPRRTLRSVGAVLAGLLSTVVVTTGVDIVFHATGVFPPMGQQMAGSLFVLALAYRIPLNIGGAYLAARLAGTNPMRHALALGVVGLVISTVGAFAMWDFGPGWYSIANIVIALPCCWTGGWIRTRAR